MNDKTMEPGPITDKTLQKEIRERVRPRIWQWDYLGLMPLLREVRLFASAVEREDARRILDLGCGVKPYASLFSCATEYVGVDAAKNERVDAVCMNWDLPFAEDSFDALVSTQVLEHTAKVFETVREIRRVVKDGGLIFISAPLAFPEHLVPHDYWRFTQYGLRELFRDFEVLTVKPQNGYLNTLFRLWNVFLRYIPGSPVWCAPVFCLNNIAALILDRIARVVGSLGIAALKDGYERGYLAFPESYVIVLRNRKKDGKGPKDQ